MLWKAQWISVIERLNSLPVRKFHNWFTKRLLNYDSLDVSQHCSYQKDGTILKISPAHIEQKRNYYVTMSFDPILTKWMWKAPAEN